jgi:hypothetical protein
MNRVSDKISIGRVKGVNVSMPWWGNCPVCPIHLGFMVFPAHRYAINWADDHLVKVHGVKSYVERNNNAG